MYADNGRLNVHRPFLDRLSQKKPDAACSLAAFLLLNVIDGLRHQNFDADALNLRVNAAYNPLATVSDREPQVRYLVRLAERLRQAIQQRQAVLVIPELLGYAEWLAFDSRFEEGLSVLNTGRYITGKSHSEMDIKIQRRRGYMLRHLGLWEEARHAYEDGLREARRCDDEYLEMRCKNGLAIVWLHHGRSVEAVDLLRTVRLRARKRGLRHAQACSSHDLAIATFSQDQSALVALSDAYFLYQDARSKNRTVSDLARFCVRAGHFEEARTCADAVRRRQEGSAFRAAALGTELWLAGQTKDRKAFERAQLEADEIDDQVRVTSAIDIKLRLGQGHLIFGEIQKAKRLLYEAREIIKDRAKGESSAAIDVSLGVLDGKRALGDIIIEPQRLGADPTDKHGNSTFVKMFRDVCSDI